MLTVFLKMKYQESKDYILHEHAADLVLRCLIISGGKLRLANSVAKSQ
jgi:hypothetical protein